MRRVEAARASLPDPLGEEDRFLAAFEIASASLHRRVHAAARASGPRWPDRLRAGLRGLLRYIDEEPAAARLVIVEARASSPAGLRRRDELLGSFAACIDSMVRRELQPPPSAIVAVGVVAGIESALYSRLRAEEADGLEALVPALVQFAQLAYAPAPYSPLSLRDGARGD